MPTFVKKYARLRHIEAQSARHLFSSRANPSEGLMVTE